MNVTWRSEETPGPVRITPAGWLRVVLRGTALGLVLLAGVTVFSVLRLAERPRHGRRRPWSPFVTRAVCRAALAILGIRRRVIGRPMRGGGAVVANHASWLDIFTLNAVLRVTFVSKAEVAGWPGIGFLARITDTLFISRDPRHADRQRAQLTEALHRRRMPLFFPEGTSTDGLRVLPFKSAIFGAFFTADPMPDLSVQPVSVIYTAPEGAEPRFYGWWGDMEFGPHALKLLAQAPQGAATLVCHDPLRVADFRDRKALARACEAAVRDGFDRHR